MKKKLKMLKKPIYIAGVGVMSAMFLLAGPFEQVRADDNSNKEVQVPPIIHPIEIVSDYDED